MFTVKHVHAYSVHYYSKVWGQYVFFYALKHFLLSVLNTFVENAILHFLPGFFAELKVQKNSIYLKYIFLYVKDFVTFDQFNASLNVIKKRFL